MSSGSNRLHVHVENLSTQDPVFHLTPQVYRLARRAFPGLASRLRVTFGVDLRGFERHMRTAQMLVGWRFPRTGLARVAPRLRLIQLTGAGVEHLMPLDWLPAEVALANNRGVHADKACEFAMTALLMLNAEVPRMADNQRLKRWEKAFTPCIAGRTALVVGVGHMGGAAAKGAKQLGMRVLGIRRSGGSHRHVDRMYRLRDLHRVLPQADFVIITAPLTPQTEGLIGAREFALMRRGCGFINMGRADVVDYAALRTSLLRGHLGGAVLDVFSPEPLPKSSSLWRTPRLFVTPHCSSDEAGRYADLTFGLVLRQAERLLRGKPALGEVRPDLGY
jgi:phosphoglycerate dehydrogenase-like enzyme